ncbi:hypothetical protein [Streptomyces johnsoniae]|uniref:Uncharacterized protein n=1 Tax=Streptomyces johnsoniae TaxID=3075532 RepID=A0ABU2S5Q3_9ACTN|nr:hypothetical protein [Streptomyces sp. DSM 41886]MDT0444153.1 hypothetical protein [Streptomyces sp. DSM 41886]
MAAPPVHGPSHHDAGGTATTRGPRMMSTPGARSSHPTAAPGRTSHVSTSAT